jgi:eukaryotic-like serine/threonine-protein kinase
MGTPVPRAMTNRPLIGSVLGGKYRVRRILGEGGVGVVVEARHIELRRPVALKLLSANDPEQIARLQREARAAARLESVHATKVIDVGRLADGAPFIVMELLHGEDLGEVIARGPLPVEVAIDYILQACEAVAEGHACGIVHRDLKPRNLFLTRSADGNALVKVLDFGLAKTTEHDPIHKPLTRPAVIMGSPQYMSPEQMRASRDVDARTDIWALGVCLYELLTGAFPFVGPTFADLYAAILGAPPVPIERYRPDLPRPLVDAIRRCMEKDPAWRFAAIADLAAALEPFAPPQARGTSERLRTVVHRSAVRADLRDTANVSVLESTGPPAARGAPVSVAFAAGALVVGLCSLLVLNRQPPRVSNAEQVGAPVAVVPGGDVTAVAVPPPTSTALYDDRPAAPALPDTPEKRAGKPDAAAPARTSLPAASKGLSPGKSDAGGNPSARF